MNAATYTPAADALALVDLWFSIAPKGHYLEVRPLHKHGQVKPIRRTFHTDPIEAAQRIAEAEAHEDDVYVGALPRRVPRGTDDAIGALCWLWADIDYGTTGHAKPAPYSSAADAADAVSRASIPPTLVVDTGGGFHVWYALSPEPGHADWREAINRLGYALGGDANARDVARILRVPGTTNRKVEGQPRPSRIVSIDPNVRHPVTAFLSLPAVPADEPEPEPDASAGPQAPRPYTAADRPFDRANDVPIAEVITWLGGKMHREGARVYCACPAHHGKNPSQMIVGGSDSNTAHCFGDCQRSYGPVDLVAAHHHIEPREAVNRLADRFNFEGFKAPRAIQTQKLAQVVQHPSAPRVPPSAPAPTQQQPLDPQDWRSTLECNAKGQPRGTIGNLAIVMENHPKYRGRLSYNQMLLSPMYADDSGHIHPTRDSFDTDARLTCEQSLGLTPSTGNIREVIGMVAEQHPYHPVKQYLSGLTWDQRHRIDRVAPDILHAHEPIAAVMVRKWFVSAVARAMQPGCKVDTALVLQGEQDALKSTFFATLGGEWFSDSRMDISRPDSYLQLHAAWIYEWAEIETVQSRKEAGEVKSFVSSATDTFRKPYGRTVERHPRSGVIVGTTNEVQFLSDRTGARRFWIVRVPAGLRVDIQALTDWRDQLWAEAVHLHREGHVYWLDRDDDRVAQAAVAAEHETEDARVTPIVEWLSSDEATKEPITMHRVLTRALKLEPGRYPRGIEREVGALLRQLGWSSGSARTAEGFVRAWRKDERLRDSNPNVTP